MDHLFEQYTTSSSPKPPHHHYNNKIPNMVMILDDDDEVVHDDDDEYPNNNNPIFEKRDPHHPHPPHLLHQYQYHHHPHHHNPHEVLDLSHNNPYYHHDDDDDGEDSFLRTTTTNNLLNETASSIMILNSDEVTTTDDDDRNDNDYDENQRDYRMMDHQIMKDDGNSELESLQIIQVPNLTTTTTAKSSLPSYNSSLEKNVFGGAVVIAADELVPIMDRKDNLSYDTPTLVFTTTTTSQHTRRTYQTNTNNNNTLGNDNKQMTRTVTTSNSSSKYNNNNNNTITNQSSLIDLTLYHDGSMMSESVVAPKHHRDEFEDPKHHQTRILSQDNGNTNRVRSDFEKDYNTDPIGIRRLYHHHTKKNEIEINEQNSFPMEVDVVVPNGTATTIASSSSLNHRNNSSSMDNSLRRISRPSPPSPPTTITKKSFHEIVNVEEIQEDKNKNHDHEKRHHDDLKHPYVEKYSPTSFQHRMNTQNDTTTYMMKRRATDTSTSADHYDSSSSSSNSNNGFHGSNHNNNHHRDRFGIIQEKFPTVGVQKHTVILPPPTISTMTPPPATTTTTTTTVTPNPSSSTNPSSSVVSSSTAAAVAATKPTPLTGTNTNTPNNKFHNHQNKSTHTEYDRPTTNQNKSNFYDSDKNSILLSSDSIISGNIDQYVRRMLSLSGSNSVTTTAVASSSAYKQTRGVKNRVSSTKEEVSLTIPQNSIHNNMKNRNTNKFTNDERFVRDEENNVAAVFLDADQLTKNNLRMENSGHHIYNNEKTNLNHNMMMMMTIQRKKSNDSLTSSTIPVYSTPNYTPKNFIRTVKESQFDIRVDRNHNNKVGSSSKLSSVVSVMGNNNNNSSSSSSSSKAASSDSKSAKQITIRDEIDDSVGILEAVERTVGGNHNEYYEMDSSVNGTYTNIDGTKNLLDRLTMLYGDVDHHTDHKKDTINNTIATSTLHFGKPSSTKTAAASTIMISSSADYDDLVSQVAVKAPSGMMNSSQTNNNDSKQHGSTGTTSSSLSNLDCFNYKDESEVIFVDGQKVFTTRSRHALVHPTKTKTTSFPWEHTPRQKETGVKDTSPSRYNSSYKAIDSTIPESIELSPRSGYCHDTTTTQTTTNTNANGSLPTPIKSPSTPVVIQRQSETFAAEVWNEPYSRESLQKSSRSPHLYSIEQEFEETRGLDDRSLLMRKDERNSPKSPITAMSTFASKSNSNSLAFNFQDSKMMGRRTDSLPTNDWPEQSVGGPTMGMKDDEESSATPFLSSLSRIPRDQSHSVKIQYNNGNTRGQTSLLGSINDPLEIISVSSTHLNDADESKYKKQGNKLSTVDGGSYTLVLERPVVVKELEVDEVVDLVETPSYQPFGGSHLAHDIKNLDSVDDGHFQPANFPKGDPFTIISVVSSVETETPLTVGTLYPNATSNKEQKEELVDAEENYRAIRKERKKIPAVMKVESKYNAMSREEVKKVKKLMESMKHNRDTSQVSDELKSKEEEDKRRNVEVKVDEDITQQEYLPPAKTSPRAENIVENGNIDSINGALRTPDHVKFLQNQLSSEYTHPAYNNNNKDVKVATLASTNRRTEEIDSSTAIMSKIPVDPPVETFSYEYDNSVIASANPSQILCVENESMEASFKTSTNSNITNDVESPECNEQPNNIVTIPVGTDTIFKPSALGTTVEALPLSTTCDILENEGEEDVHASQKLDEINISITSVEENPNSKELEEINASSTAFEDVPASAKGNFAETESEQISVDSEIRQSTLHSSVTNTQELISSAAADLLRRQKKSAMRNVPPLPAGLDTSLVKLANLNSPIVGAAEAGSPMSNDVRATSIPPVVSPRLLSEVWSLRNVISSVDSASQISQEFRFKPSKQSGTDEKTVNQSPFTFEYELASIFSNSTKGTEFKSTDATSIHNNTKGGFEKSPKQNRSSPQRLGSPVSVYSSQHSSPINNPIADTVRKVYSLSPTNIPLKDLSMNPSPRSESMKGTRNDGPTSNDNITHVGRVISTEDLFDTNNHDGESVERDNDIHVVAGSASIQNDEKIEEKGRSSESMETGDQTKSTSKYTISRSDTNGSENNEDGTTYNSETKVSLLDTLSSESDMEVEVDTCSLSYAYHLLDRTCAWMESDEFLCGYKSKPSLLTKVKQWERRRKVRQWERRRQTKINGTSRGRETRLNSRRRAKECDDQLLISMHGKESEKNGSRMSTDIEAAENLMAQKRVSPYARPRRPSLKSSPKAEKVEESLAFSPKTSRTQRIENLFNEKSHSPIPQRSNSLRKYLIERDVEEREAKIDVRNMSADRSATKLAHKYSSDCSLFNLSTSSHAAAEHVVGKTPSYDDHLKTNDVTHAHTGQVPKPSQDEIDSIAEDTENENQMGMISAQPTNEMPQNSTSHDDDSRDQPNASDNNGLLKNSSMPPQNFQDDSYSTEPSRISPPASVGSDSETLQSYENTDNERDIEFVDVESTSQKSNTDGCDEDADARCRNSDEDSYTSVEYIMEVKTTSPLHVNDDFDSNKNEPIPTVSTFGEKENCSDDDTQQDSFQGHQSVTNEEPQIEQRDEFQSESINFSLSEDSTRQIDDIESKEDEHNDSKHTRQAPLSPAAELSPINKNVEESVAPRPDHDHRNNDDAERQKSEYKDAQDEIKPLNLPSSPFLGNMDYDSIQGMKNLRNAQEEETITAIELAEKLRRRAAALKQKRRNRKVPQRIPSPTISVSSTMENM